MLASQRWSRSFPFFLALLILASIIGSAWLAYNYPFDGILGFDTNGQITELDSYGYQMHLEPKDVIKTVNGLPFGLAVPFHTNRQVGDTVRFVVERNGDQIAVDIPLISQPLLVVLIELVPLLVALIFWGIGVMVLVFNPNDPASNLFFVFSQVSALLLAAGSASAIGPPWTSNLFWSLIWIFGPVAVHFHLYFPQIASFRHRRLLLGVLYGVALGGGIINSRVRSFQVNEQLHALGMIFLAANMLIVVGLLFHDYRHAASPGVRGRIRIVMLGAALSLTPLVTLFFLPEALQLQTVFPYYFAFFFLAILPVTYAYAIIRHRLIQIDRPVNRGATLILVFSILAGIYAVLYGFFRFLALDLQANALVTTLLVIILASVFSPLYRKVQRLVDTAFYGGWYDYRSAVTRITQGLEQITDLRELAKIIGNRLVKTLQLEDAVIFMRDRGGVFSVVEVVPEPKADSASRPEFLPLPKNSLTYLLNVGAIGRSALRENLIEANLSPEERQLLESEQVYLWVPVIRHGEVLGLLALGSKLGGDIFSGEDMDILRVVARQLGPLIENTHLVTELREYAAELELRVEERTAELHAAKERVEAVLSSVGDGVFVTDLGGNILTVNRAFEGQSGYLAAEIAGRSMFTLLSEREDQARQAEIRIALQSRSSWSGELMAQHKSGREYDVYLTIAPVRNQDGETMGYVGSQRDITQSKELERLKDQFILEVSHELRTPVTNMGLYAELLERGRPERKAEYTAILRSEITHLMRMIEDILDLSRLEIGKYKKATFGPVDVNLLADQVVAAHTPLASESGLKLTFSPGGNLPPIIGEQNQLARVLTNLISNSIRYTQSGFVKVSTYSNDTGVYVEVQDSGMGIDPEDLPHLFERFYRGQRVSQSKISGSGLGLAIVKEIVELHDGQIYIDSVPGAGSTFRVWLPAEPVEVIA